MAIRRIKAHTASEEGQYIRIEKQSMRVLGLVLGACIGFFLGMLFLVISEITLAPEFHFIVVVSLSVFFAALGASMASGHEVRLVPKADLVEIKRYVWPERVTVVLDDERSKPGGRPGGPKPY